MYYFKKMTNCLFIYWISSIILASQTVFGSEFSFEIPDSDEQCFYENVKANEECRLDFQVIKGGDLDIDVVVVGPHQDVIYREQRKEYDTIYFNTSIAGEYSICFSNQFSTFTHKTVFLSVEVGDENQLFKGLPEHATVLTFMESTSDAIHDSLNDVLNGQTHYRLQEAHGRLFADDLNERVLWWSLLQSFVIIAISITQVMTLRNFFNEPRMNKPVIPPRQPRFGNMQM